MENKAITVNAQPAAAVIQPAPSVVTEQVACCCVPSSASGAVKATRAMSILILLVHIISLVLGFIFFVQWIASLLGIIISSVVLCCFSKCAYATAAVLYALGALLDVYIVVARIAWSANFDSRADDDGHNGVVAFITVPSAIGAVTCTLGASFALQAVCNWKPSGAVISGAVPLSPA